MVTVSSAQPSAPQSLFGLSQCGSDPDGFLTVGCMARGFSPADSLSFKWTDPTGKEVNDFVQYPAFGKEGDYSKISHLRVKKSDWDPSKPYQCEATNTAGKKEASIAQAREKLVKDIPNVVLYEQSDINNSTRVSLVCEVSSPKLGHVNVMWRVGNEKYIKGQTSAPIHRDDSTSVLSFFNVSKEEFKKSIACGVKDANMNDTQLPIIIRTTSKSEPPEPETGFALNCNEDVIEEDEFRSLWSTATSFIFLFLFSLTYSALLSLSKMKQ